MTVHLDWRVGPRGERGPDAPAPLPRGQRTRRRPMSRQVLSVYGAGLLGAALIGFHLGRADVGRAMIVRAITAELAIEAHAVQTSDPDLFASTLDPKASVAWRHAAMVRFAAVRGQPWPTRLVALRPRADVNIVDVDVTVGAEAVAGSGAEQSATATESRVYRIENGRWIRTER